MTGLALVGELVAHVYGWDIYSTIPQNQQPTWVPHSDDPLNKWTEINLIAPQ